MTHSRLAARLAVSLLPGVSFAAYCAGCGGASPAPNVRPSEVRLSRATIAALIQQPPGLVAVVRCVSIEHVADDTRGERTNVRARVVDVARGEARGTIDLWHWGPPRMERRRTYLVAALSAPDATLLEAIPIRAHDASAVLARVRAQVR